MRGIAQAYNTLFEGPDFNTTVYFGEICRVRGIYEELSNTRARKEISRDDFVEHFMHKCLLPYNEARNRLGAAYDSIFRNGSIKIHGAYTVDGKHVSVNIEVIPLY